MIITHTYTALFLGGTTYHFLQLFLCLAHVPYMSSWVVLMTFSGKALSYKYMTQKSCTHSRNTIYQYGGNCPISARGLDQFVQFHCKSYTAPALISNYSRTSHKLKMFLYFIQIQLIHFNLILYSFSNRLHLTRTDIYKSLDLLI